MTFDRYIQSGGRYLRCGYTTGTCAALAAGAATRMLLLGKAPESVSLITPKGVRVDVVPDVCEYAESGAVRAAVRKDAGDDRDVTDGILIFATVRAESFEECAGRTQSDENEDPTGGPRTEEPENVAGRLQAGQTERRAAETRNRTMEVEISVDGGPGVGRITKPGLDQPVGSAAINHVPREMIERAVRDVCETAGFRGKIDVIISVPEGERIAKKTFNGHLGIEGGISILGTSGIVEPMSMQAFIDAVCVEIRQVRTLDGSGRLILTPGNYGMDFLKGFSLNAPIVSCSNFIGDALDAASAEGFREVLLVGHIGKLVKLAGGVMNTHSRYADCRMELFAAHAAICGGNRDVCRRIMDCVTTDACLEVLEQVGICRDVMDALLRSMQKYLDRRAGGVYSVGAVTFSNVHGFLGSSPGAKEILDRWGASV